VTVSGLDEFLWIGLHQVVNGQPFEWSSGAEVAYTHWSPNQPDDAGSKENCVHLWNRDDWGWNDHQCKMEFYPMCGKW